jgi:hypothetical protein
VTLHLYNQNLSFIFLLWGVQKSLTLTRTYLLFPTILYLGNLTRKVLQYLIDLPNN